MWPIRTAISAIYRITDSHKDGGGQERRIRMAKKRETIIFRCTAKEKEELKKRAGKRDGQRVSAGPGFQGGA